MLSSFTLLLEKICTHRSIMPFYLSLHKLRNPILAFVFIIFFFHRLYRCVVENFTGFVFHSFSISYFHRSDCVLVKFLQSFFFTFIVAFVLFGFYFIYIFVNHFTFFRWSTETTIVPWDQTLGKYQHFY